MDHRSPPPAIFAALALPAAIVNNGILSTLVSCLLRQQGVAAPAIADEISLLMLPSALFFLWSGAMGAGGLLFLAPHVQQATLGLVAGLLTVLPALLASAP